MQIKTIFNRHVTAFLGSCNSCIILKRKSKLRTTKIWDLGNRKIQGWHSSRSTNTTAG